MKLKSKCLQIGQCYAKRVTKKNRKNPEYHVAIRRLRTDKTVPLKNHGQTKLKLNEQHIGSKKTYGPQNTEQSKHNNAKERKRKCCVRKPALFSCAVLCIIMFRLFSLCRHCLHKLNSLDTMIQRRSIVFQWPNQLKVFLKRSCQNPLMSRIERKYCLISTSYLAGLFDIFILLFILQNGVCFGDFLPIPGTNEDTL